MVKDLEAYFYADDRWSHHVAPPREALEFV